MRADCSNHNPAGEGQSRKSPANTVFPHPNVCALLLDTSFSLYLPPRVFHILRYSNTEIPVVFRDDEWSLVYALIICFRESSTLPLWE